MGFIDIMDIVIRLFYYSFAILFIAAVFWVLNYFEVLPSFSIRREDKVNTYTSIVFLQNNLGFFRKQLLNRIDNRPYEKVQFLDKIKSILEDKYVVRHFNKIIYGKLIKLVGLIDEFNNKENLNSKIIDEKDMILKDIDELLNYCTERCTLLKRKEEK